MDGVLVLLLILIAAAAVIFAAALVMMIPGKPDPKRDGWVYKRNFAHRGLYTPDQSVPENSLAAFQRAVDRGYGIEMDVELTKDDVPVVFHDDTLDRMTGFHGRLWDRTYSELSKLRLAGSSQGIPTFEEFLKVAGGRVPVIVEIKNTKRIDRICSLTLKLLKKYPGTYCIESFNPVIVAWFRKNAPEIFRGQLSMRYSDEKSVSKLTQFVLENLLLNFKSKPQFIAYRHVDSDKFALRFCRKMGAAAVAWTPRNEDEYQKAVRNFDAVIFEHFLPPLSYNRPEILDLHK